MAEAESGPVDAVLAEIRELTQRYPQVGPDGQLNWGIIGSAALLLHCLARGLKPPRVPKDVDLYCFRPNEGLTDASLVTVHEQAGERVQPPGRWRTVECFLWPSGLHPGLPTAKDFVEISIGNEVFHTSSLELIAGIKILACYCLRDRDLRDYIFMLGNFDLDRKAFLEVFRRSRYAGLGYGEQLLDMEQLMPTLQGYHRELLSHFRRFPVRLDQIPYKHLAPLMLVKDTALDLRALTELPAPADTNPFRTQTGMPTQAVWQLACAFVAANQGGTDSTVIRRVVDGLSKAFQDKPPGEKTVALLLFTAFYINRLLAFDIAPERIVSCIETGAVWSLYWATSYKRLLESAN